MLRQFPSTSPDCLSKGCDRDVRTLVSLLSLVGRTSALQVLSQCVIHPSWRRSSSQCPTASETRTWTYEQLQLADDLLLRRVIPSDTFLLWTWCDTFVPTTSIRTLSLGPPASSLIHKTTLRQECHSFSLTSVRLVRSQRSSTCDASQMLSITMSSVVSRWSRSENQSRTDCLLAVLENFIRTSSCCHCRQFLHLLQLTHVRLGHDTCNTDHLFWLDKTTFYDQSTRPSCCTWIKWKFITVRRIK